MILILHEVYGIINLKQVKGLKKNKRGTQVGKGRLAAVEFLYSALFRR